MEENPEPDWDGLKAQTLQSLGAELHISSLRQSSRPDSEV